MVTRCKFVSRSFAAAQQRGRVACRGIDSGGTMLMQIAPTVIPKLVRLHGERKSSESVTRMGNRTIQSSSVSHLIKAAGAVISKSTNAMNDDSHGWLWHHRFVISTLTQCRCNFQLWFSLFQLLYCWALGVSRQALRCWLLDVVVALSDISSDILF